LAGRVGNPDPDSARGRYRAESRDWYRVFGPGHDIGIEYSGRVTTLVSSTRAGQKVGMKTRLDGQSSIAKSLLQLTESIERSLVNVYIHELVDTDVTELISSL